jgi:hypothetical protein
MPTGPAEGTRLSPTRLRRIIRQFRACPKYSLAAAAGGIDEHTLLAWRNRGTAELGALSSDQVDAVLTLRDGETSPGGRPASWEAIELQVGISISLFSRLVLELEEAQRDFVTQAFERIQQAGRGRHYSVECEDGTVEVHWQAPSWQADAWCLERLAGFTKPPAVVVNRSEEDPSAGYAQLRAQLDRLSGDDA